MPPPGTGRGADNRSVGHTHFTPPTLDTAASPIGAISFGEVLPGAAPLFDGATPADGKATLDGPATVAGAATLAGPVALMAAEGVSPNGMGLPTRGVVAGGGVDGALEAAIAGAGPDAAGGATGRPVGCSTSTWPIASLKSVAMLFHFASSR